MKHRIFSFLNQSPLWPKPNPSWQTSMLWQRWKIFCGASALGLAGLFAWGLMAKGIGSWGLAFGLGALGGWGLLWLGVFWLLKPAEATQTSLSPSHLDQEWEALQQRIEADQTQLLAAYDALEASYNALQVEREKQIQQAYKAGLAENAIAVLHNIGNAVTPLVYQLSQLAEAEEWQRWLSYLGKAQALLQEQLDYGTLDYYLRNDPKGKKLLSFMAETLLHLHQILEKRQYHHQASQVQLQHILELIATQQTYAHLQENREVLSFSRLLQDVMVLLHPSLEKSQIALEQELPPDLPALPLEKSKMMQTLLNLAKNAIESIEAQKQDVPENSGWLKIKIEWEAEGASGLLRVTLEDNGKGATQEVQARIFEFGFSTKTRGSGFGLYDCAQFIRSQGGEISFHSPGLGKGAIVSFWLPLHLGRG